MMYKSELDSIAMKNQILELDPMLVDEITEHIKEKSDYIWMDHPLTDRAISVKDFLDENPILINRIFNLKQ